jgi:hypothetical protein
MNPNDSFAAPADDVGQFDDASDDEEELVPVINELRALPAAAEEAKGDASTETAAPAGAAPVQGNPGDPFRRLAIQQLRAEQLRVEHARVEHARAEHARAEHARATHASHGIGANSHRPMNNAHMIAMDIARLRQQETQMMRRLQTTQQMLRQQQSQERQKLLARTSAPETVDLTKGSTLLGDASDHSGS